MSGFRGAAPPPPANENIRDLARNVARDAIPAPLPAPLTVDLLIDLAMDGRHRTLIVPPDQEQQARDLVTAIGVDRFVTVIASAWLPDGDWYLATAPVQIGPGLAVVVAPQPRSGSLDAVVRDFVGGAPTATTALTFDAEDVDNSEPLPDSVISRSRGLLASIALNPVTPLPCPCGCGIDWANPGVSPIERARAELGAPPTPSGDVLADIDAATEGRCACGCGEPITDQSESAWFASPDCQQNWAEQHATNPGEVYARPDAAPYPGDIGAMRWRPDLLTADPRPLEPLPPGVDEFLAVLSRYNATTGLDPVTRLYVLRLDDGHRYVETTVDYGTLDGWLATKDTAAVQAAWEALGRQLSDPRLVNPDDPDHAIGDPGVTPPAFGGFNWLYEHASRFAARLTEQERAAGRLPADMSFVWTYEPTPTEGT